MAKIGLSYSRCVRDIFEGKVNIDDVLVIIARTQFDPREDNQWKGIWSGYGAGDNGKAGMWSNPEWLGIKDSDESTLRNISLDLLNMGKLFQPRMYGVAPARLPYYWLETCLPDDELESHPAAKHAWEQFQIISRLSGFTPYKNKFNF